jgi:hypothetical protein
MKSHFFDLKREYLGTLDLDFPKGEVLCIPVMQKLEVPLRLTEDEPPAFSHMKIRRFFAVPIYKLGTAFAPHQIDFITYLEVT